MSRILKRPMFRKGGKAMDGVMSLAAPRKQYQEGGSTFDDLIEGDDYLKEIYDIAQAGYGRDIQRERKDVLANLLIKGGLGLVSGEGAGKGTLGAIATAFKKPTEQALTQLQSLKQDPAKMLVAKTAIAQKGAERLKTLELQNQRIDAEKKARVMLGPDASPEDIRKKASEILEANIFGVEKRFEEGIKQDDIQIIQKQFLLDKPEAEKYYQFNKKRDEIESKTGKDVRGFLQGSLVKGRISYDAKARNALPGIYYDPVNDNYVEIRNGVATIIPDPLATSSMPSEADVVSQEVETESVVRNSNMRGMNRSPEVVTEDEEIITTTGNRPKSQRFG
jgi:hypothetical protein